MLQNYATGATFPELSGNRMKKIKVLVPDMQTQMCFEAISKSIIHEMDKLENENDLLAQQRDLLLPRLMSGKLEV
jgi:type I restriction enzyme S subunit